MEAIKEVVKQAQSLLKDRLVWLDEQKLGEGGIGGFTPDIYARFLTMQYHLTHGVQRYLMSVAAHPDLASRQSLRKFLFDFANEEELHYLIAERDLQQMGRKPGACPLDVQLWKAYYDSVVEERPFLRLGGTCVLENITVQGRAVLGKLVADSPFLTPKNTKFLVIHQHNETLPHGDQIFEALGKAKLEPHHLQDLLEGSRIASVIFLRLIDWCLSGDEMQDLKRHFAK